MRERQRSTAGEQRTETLLEFLLRRMTRDSVHASSQSITTKMHKVRQKKLTR